MSAPSFNVIALVIGGAAGAIAAGLGVHLAQRHARARETGRDGLAAGAPRPPRGHAGQPVPQGDKPSPAAAEPETPAAEPARAAGPTTDADAANAVSAPTSENSEKAQGTAPKPAPEPLDMEALTRELMEATDPIAELKSLARKVDAAERRAHDDAAEAPDPLAAYLARGLREAGLLDADVHWPDVAVVRTSRSKTFYLRVSDESVAWGDMLRVLAVEGALNRALFAWEHFRKHGDGSAETDLTLEDCYRFNQALASSITAQLGPTPIPRAAMSDLLGEWGVRQTISAGIETFRLPLRLTARFRVNLMGGDAAIVASFMPAAVQPASVWSPDLDRIVPATHEMRERMATEYAQRCALLLAAHAFRSSRRICHAFVAIVLETPSRRTCLVSGDVSRDDLRENDLSEDFDAAAMCERLGIRFHTENGALAPIDQGFDLDSERFCPRGRYDSVDLSGRVLPSFEASLLGAEHVCDLSINESARRASKAQEVVRELGGSTERSVRRILRLTENDPDATVREAGRRTACRLIDGSLSANDGLAFVDDFVEGDDLSRAIDQAMGLIQSGRASEAVDVLTDLLAPIDSLDTYRDEGDDTWRQFMSYVSRTLYNRLFARPGERTHLVPDAYYGAQLLMSSALISLGRTDEALGFARRAQDLDPLDMSAMLRIVRCHELAGDLDAATAELRRWLDVAFDPQGIGVGYYRLAFLEWRRGNLDVADACYQKAAVSRCSYSGSAALELQTMRALSGCKPVEPDEVDAALEAASVPLAPTERVVNVLVEAAQASTDAEVFPVARSFATLLGALTGDDVMNGVVESMEHEPDR